MGNSTIQFFVHAVIQFVYEIQCVMKIKRWHFKCHTECRSSHVTFLALIVNLHNSIVHNSITLSRHSIQISHSFFNDSINLKYFNLIQCTKLHHFRRIFNTFYDLMADINTWHVEIICHQYWTIHSKNIEWFLLTIFIFYFCFPSQKMPPINIVYAVDNRLITWSNICYIESIGLSATFFF